MITLGDVLDEKEAAQWVEVESFTRKGLLCALVGVDPEVAVMEESGLHVRIRVPGEDEPRVMLRGVGERVAVDAIRTINSCQDCMFCQVRDDYDPEVGGPLWLECAEDSSIRLSNGNLGTRPENCPRAGAITVWSRSRK